VVTMLNHAAMPGLGFNVHHGQQPSLEVKPPLMILVVF